MESTGLTSAEFAELRNKMRTAVLERPPTVGVIGLSGVGKSSTLNALFSTGLATSSTVACTTEFRHIDLDLQARDGALASQPVRLRVVDAPGLGEDCARDQIGRAPCRERW